VQITQSNRTRIVLALALLIIGLGLILFSCWKFQDNGTSKVQTNLPPTLKETLSLTPVQPKPGTSDTPSISSTPSSTSITSMPTQTTKESSDTPPPTPVQTNSPQITPYGGAILAPPDLKDASPITTGSQSRKMLSLFSIIFIFLPFANKFRVSSNRKWKILAPSKSWLIHLFMTLFKIY